jgi:hypothetical protein
MIPIKFEYTLGFECVCVIILDQHKHHYTGKNVVYIREEGDRGWTHDHYVTEEELNRLLAMRVRDDV